MKIHSLFMFAVATVVFEFAPAVAQQPPRVVVRNDLNESIQVLLLKRDPSDHIPGVNLKAQTESSVQPHPTNPNVQFARGNRALIVFDGMGQMIGSASIGIRAGFVNRFIIQRDQNGDVRVLAALAQLP